MLDEKVLYKEFGVNAEYLIDHARGEEPCTIAQIQAYVPEGSSMTSGQVLSCDYTFEEARTVLKEMVDGLVLDLVDKGMVASSISLMVGYAHPKGVDDGWRGSVYVGEHGARPAGPRSFNHTGGTRRLGESTDSLKRLLPRFLDLYDETTRRDVAVRRMHVGFGQVMPEEYAELSLFADDPQLAQEKSLQKAVLAVKGKFGKNALLKGTSFLEKATARERNEQVGGHHG